MSPTVLALGKSLAGPATVGVFLSVGVVVRLVVGDGPRARAWTWRLAWLGLATFGGWQLAVLAVLPDGNTDLKVFLTAGRESAAGRDPYSSGGEMVALNPPPAQGLFRVAAALPYPAVAAGWSLLNAALVLALVPLGNRLLASDRDDDPRHAPPALPPDLTALLAAAVLNSNAALRGHRWGQLCALTAFALTAALRCRQDGRPWRAGAWLAVAAFKPATALPFLLLFLRRADRRAWVALGCVSAALAAVAAPPGAWPGLLLSNVRRIGVSAGPGKINDYGFDRDESADLVAVDQALHRLGLRDRRVIAGLQWVAVAGLLAVLAAHRHRRPFGAAAGLAAAGSMLVLYHRTYDGVVLALPLVHAAAVARATAGRRRAWALAAVGLLLAALDQPREALTGLTAWSLSHGVAGRAVQAAVLTMPTWTVVAGLLALLACVTADAPARSAGPHVGRVGGARRAVPELAGCADSVG